MRRRTAARKKRRPKWRCETFSKCEGEQPRTRGPGSQPCCETFSKCEGEQLGLTSDCYNISCETFSKCEGEQRWGPGWSDACLAVKPSRNAKANSRILCRTFPFPCCETFSKCEGEQPGYGKLGKAVQLWNLLEMRRRTAIECVVLRHFWAVKPSRNAKANSLQPDEPLRAGLWNLLEMRRRLVICAFLCVILFLK